LTNKGGQRHKYADEAAQKIIEAGGSFVVEPFDNQIQFAALEVRLVSWCGPGLTVGYPALYPEQTAFRVAFGGDPRLAEIEAELEELEASLGSPCLFVCIIESPYLEKIKMELVPNLHFNGNCEEAIESYEQAFGGKRTVFLRNKDANPLDSAGQSTMEKPENIYHAEMVIGNHRIMLNDSDSGLPIGMNVSLLVSMDSVEAVKAAYNKLKEGARIISPISETTYSSCFVSLVDRFGVRWELIKENEGEN
jgi:PhnB protein